MEGPSQQVTTLGLEFDLLRKYFRMSTKWIRRPEEVREPSLVSFGDVLPGNSFESRAGELPASRGSCAFRRPLCLTSAELVVTGQAMWLAGVIPSRCLYRFAKNCMRRGGF